MDVSQVAFGLFLVVLGVPAVLDHPLVDGFNRRMKALGTSRRASEIEMSSWSVLFGRIAGGVMALAGAGYLVAGLS